MGQVVGVLADLSGLSSDAARDLHVLANGMNWEVASFKNLRVQKSHSCSACKRNRHQARKVCNYLYRTECVEKPRPRYLNPSSESWGKKRRGWDSGHRDKGGPGLKSARSYMKERSDLSELLTRFGPCSDNVLFQMSSGRLVFVLF